MEIQRYDTDIWTIPGLLSVAECHAFIARGEAMGFNPTLHRGKNGELTPSQYRSSDWCEFEDASLADDLWQRCHLQVPNVLDNRVVTGIHTKFEYFRYEVGQKFKRHRDMQVHLPTGEVSIFTLLLYLNDDFSGGETIFSDYTFSDNGERQIHSICVAPVSGTALFFAFNRWHEGAAVSIGQKYVIRGDVLYRPQLSTDS